MVKNSMDYMHTQYDLDEDVELMDEFESLDPVLNEFQTSWVKYISRFIQRKRKLNDWNLITET